jgi:hypothetical protein
MTSLWGSTESAAATGKIEEARLRRTLTTVRITN